VKIVTVGDTLCQVLETLKDKRVIRRSGVWTMRESSLATRFANLVVAPDTGLIHASGCFSTPKICLIGSNSIENITKHFENDYSITADENLVPCAPCHRLIYSASQQCPIEEQTGLPKCMALGINPKRVFERISGIISKHKAHSEGLCV
jgi:ADP-heptose:LPS heptosyltransferase